jgi:hypothetical protein
LRGHREGRARRTGRALIIALIALSCDTERARLSVYGLEERYTLSAALVWSDCELSGAQLSAEGVSGDVTVSALASVVYLELPGGGGALTATLCEEGGEPKRLCLYGERASGFTPSALSGAGEALSRCEARVTLSPQGAPSAARCCEGGLESALEVTRGEGGRARLTGKVRGSLSTRPLSPEGEALTDEASAARCGGAQECSFEVQLEANP